MTPNKITSSSNSKIKSVVQLRNRKERKVSELTIVEGVRELIRALEAKVAFKEIYICHELLNSIKDDHIAAPRCRNLIEKLSSLKASVYEMPKAVFSKIAYGNRTDGVLAVCAPHPIFLEDLKVKNQALYVVVEAVEKPGNLGAILRTCDGAGVDGVIVCNSKTDIYNPNVIRASLGTVFSNKVVISSNDAAIKFLRTDNVTVCAALPQAKTLYTRTKLTDSIAFVVGSEQMGLTKFWHNHADVKIKIPMKGKADSLNVSASTAILLYETIRQRAN